MANNPPPSMMMMPRPNGQPRPPSPLARGMVRPPFQPGGATQPPQQQQQQQAMNNFGQPTLGFQAPSGPNSFPSGNAPLPGQAPPRIGGGFAAPVTARPPQQNFQPPPSNAVNNNNFRPPSPGFAPTGNFQPPRGPSTAGPGNFLPPNTPTTAPSFSQQPPSTPGFGAPPRGGGAPFSAPGFTPSHPSQQHHAPMAHSAGVPAKGSMMVSLDPKQQCPTDFCRLTFEKFPESEIVRQRAGALPLAAIFRPFCDLPGTPPVPSVNFGSNAVVRCRRCRSYISPFAFFIDSGRKWQCALCWNVNEVEPDYFVPLNPETGKRQDYYERIELQSGIIDIIAPDEYTLRPPPPPAFLFLIDVSQNAIQSGMLQAVTIGIKRSLSRLPGQKRTQVGIITFDSEIHFYDLSGGPEGSGGPRMLIVTDLNQMFHPTSTDDLLVDLHERRHCIETLLDQLPTMHSGHNTDSAIGPAIEAAFDIIAPIGGKLSMFQTQLPMMVEPAPGDDKVMDKEFLHHGGLPKPGRGADGRTLGGPNEHEFLQPAIPWYVTKADTFCRQHISLDWYCCAQGYTDLASIAELCHLTAGKLRYYPKFVAYRDGERLTRDIERSLTSVCATEAVMRVRASSGVRVSRFFGSFTMRARDLISLPQSDPDGVHGFEFAFEEDLLAGKFIALQSAVLYTTLNGERRIRVTNQAIPLSSNPIEVLQGMQPDVVAAIFFKRAAEESRESVGGLDQARNQLKVSFWKLLEPQGFASNNPQLIEIMARYIVGCIKSSALRGGTDIGYDERYFLLRLVGRASVDRLIRMMKPKLWVLNLKGGPAQEVPTSRQSLNPEMVFFLDNGVHFMIWIGSRSSPQYVQQIFSVEDINKVDPSTLRVTPPPPSGETPLKAQIWSLLNECRKFRPEDFAQCIVVREGDTSIEPRFYWNLINDPATFRGGEISVEDLMTKGARAANSVRGGFPPAAPVTPSQGNPRGPSTPMGAAPPPRGNVIGPSGVNVMGPPGTSVMGPPGGNVMGGRGPATNMPQGPGTPRGPMNMMPGPNQQQTMGAPRPNAPRPMMPSPRPSSNPPPLNANLQPPSPRPQMPPSMGMPPTPQVGMLPPSQGMVPPSMGMPPTTQGGMLPPSQGMVPPSHGSMPPPRGTASPQMHPQGNMPPPTQGMSQGVPPRGQGAPPPPRQMGNGPPSVRPPSNGSIGPGGPGKVMGNPMIPQINIPPRGMPPPTSGGPPM